MTGDPIYDIYLAMLGMGVGLCAVVLLSARWSDRKYGFDSKTGLPIRPGRDQ